jgi:hypothetical protein
MGCLFCNIKILVEALTIIIFASLREILSTPLPKIFAFFVSLREIMSILLSKNLCVLCVSARNHINLHLCEQQNKTTCNYSN